MPKGAGGYQFDIIPDKDWPLLTAALGMVDMKLVTGLETEVAQLAQELAHEAAAAATKLPAPSGRQLESSGLRMTIAAGVGTWKNRAGIEARVITTMPYTNQAALPRGYDTPKGWRHPVYGNQNVWVQQPGGQWFLVTMQKSHEEAMARIKALFETVWMLIR